MEVQLACFEQGDRFGEHVDSVANEGACGRRLTLTWYLNDCKGGELALRDLLGTEVEIQPRIDQLVVFLSTLRHEVKPVVSKRMAVTTWFY
jgi:Rps23 Pro-64 3,4-dihydroxylase Tpa1-like proline 4-hydroxylase